MEPEVYDKGETIHESVRNDERDGNEQEIAAAKIDTEQDGSNFTKDADIAVESSDISKIIDKVAIEQGEEEVKLIISDAEVQGPSDEKFVVHAESTLEEPNASDSEDAPAIPNAPIAITSNTLSIPALQKKFTSLSVNKQFLEKASPTSTTLVTPIVNKVTTSQPLGRLVSSSPASRLTSAKLSTSVAKPSSIGWGQINSPGLASPGTDPLSSVLAGSSVKSSTTGASPKLVTALTSGNAARSTSPHQKGSPGLRNASLAASGRSGLTNSSTSSSSNTKAPWASVKTENAKVKSNLVNDFPTAAEAARAKLEAERREKAAAAEAAARAEQTLQTLERFRGASIGPGNHWDEMDDEDDLDEVVQFGDGTQYKVPVTKEEEPVSKEERFKDVGHDRSWPLSSNAAQQAITANQTVIQQSAPTARPSIATRNLSTRDPSLLSPSSQEPQVPPKLFNSRHATKIEIKAGEGVSLDTDVDRGYNNSQRGNAFYRRDRDSPASHSSSSHAHTHAHAQGSGSSNSAAAAPVRAWGPLAQRQASLNPDAPKPAIVSPPASQKAASIASPTLSSAVAAAATSQPLLRNASQQSNEQSNVKSASSARGTGSNNERAIPPHLVAQASASDKSQSSTTNDTTSELAPVQATPYGARFAASANKPTSPNIEKAPPVILRPEKSSVVTAENQREEMLSAAERARKRRQEEEELRLAEKERAKAKADAIEEKMRIAKEEELKKEREEEEARLQKRDELEEGRRKDQEVSSASAHSTQRREADIRPALMSPSDEAVTWRRGISAPAAAPVLGPNNAANTSVTSFQDIRPMPLETTLSQPMTLLQRPASKSTTEVLSPNNSRPDIADVSKTRNGNALVDRKPRSEAKAPTGPKGNNGNKATTSDSLHDQSKTNSRVTRVDIIAPTDARAALHHEEQEKQREARQTQKLPGKQPISVLKSPAATDSATVIIPPEDAATRKEVEFDGVPVWNRYKVKVGASRPAPKLPLYVIKAQKVRIAEFKRPESEPRSVEVLSWDPPMPFLSSRTLSRDDLFHPKKYRKGIVIANVALPKDLLEKGSKRSQQSQQQEGLKNTMPLIVKVPSFKAAADSVRQNSGSKPVTSFDRKSVQPEINADVVQVTSRNSLDPVMYSTPIAARVNTPSPVSFLNSNEVMSIRNSQIALPTSQTSVDASSTTSAPHPSVLPKSSSNPTWGQTTLFNLETENTGRGVEEGDHIRQVWSHASNDNGNMQNSLKDIVDEFPDVAAQYHDVGINTINEVANNRHSSTPASRLYSPSVVPHEVNQEFQRNEKKNGFNTSASSPPFASNRGLQSKGDATMGEADGNLGQRIERGPQYSQSGYSNHYTNNAFSAYAYPSPIDELSQRGSYSNQGQYRNQHQYNQYHYKQQQQQQQQHQPRYSGAHTNGMEYMSSGGNQGGGYESIYRSSSNPPPQHNQSMLNNSYHGQQNYHQQQSSYYNGQQAASGGGGGGGGGGSHRSTYNSNSPGSMRNNLYPPGAARGNPIRGYRSNDTSSTVW